MTFSQASDIFHIKLFARRVTRLRCTGRQLYQFVPTARPERPPALDGPRRPAVGPVRLAGWTPARCSLPLTPRSMPLGRHAT